MKKLDVQHKHILRLIDRDAGKDGWTPVSDALFKVLPDAMPGELVIFEQAESGARAKLTAEGVSVVSAMKWL